MDANDRRRGSGGVLRVAAIPVAVLIAGAGCTATVAALTASTLPTVRVTVGEEPAPRDPGPPAAEEEPDGPPDPESAEPGPPEPGTEGSGPQGAEDGQDSAGPHTEGVPPSAYTGASTAFGPFHVVVDTCYTDTSITDGMGTHATAPSGMEYHIYRLHVTNEGSGPAVFDTAGTTALTTDGKEFVNDAEAEFTVAWDYLWDEINPGTTVTSYVVLTAPVGTEFSEVMLGGVAPITPG
ncbi:DUF4352 domain-containing protein [Nocardiopsis sp. NPDC057823]|uniref:DUF4352 domain-containing protein n=1 Tax=Nocardiopsis sp. NPDC057823 TaxID=3346256 RepID=UPI00366E6D9F